MTQNISLPALALDVESLEGADAQTRAAVVSAALASVLAGAQASQADTDAAEYDAIVRTFRKDARNASLRARAARDAQADPALDVKRKREAVKGTSGTARLLAQADALDAAHVLAQARERAAEQAHAASGMRVEVKRAETARAASRAYGARARVEQDRAASATALAAALLG